MKPFQGIQIKKSTKAVLILGAMGLGLNSLFTNCADAKFDSLETSQSVVNSGTPNDNVEIVKKACDRTNTIERTQKIEFKNPRNASNPKKSCGWGQNGNAGTEDLRQSMTGDPANSPHVLAEDKFTARAEQRVALDLPANAVICDLSFAFTKQKMIYDDHMLFMYDDVVLAATKPVEHLLQKSEGMSLYDWTRLVNKPWKFGDGVAYTYCFGEESGKASCSWPLSMQEGTIELEYDPSVLMKVAARNLTRSQHAFTLATTGDNNPDSDCQHSDFSFDVKISYSSL